MKRLVENARNAKNDVKMAIGNVWAPYMSAKGKSAKL